MYVLEQKKGLWLMFSCFQGSLVKKDLPTRQKTWVWFLGPEDPLEKEMAAQSSILA